MTTAPAPGTGVASTETYDGTTWTETSNLATGRYSLGGAGSSNASALGFGGRNAPGFLTTTEEWNVSISTTTAAAWASGGNLNTARYGAGSSGTQTAGLVFSGTTANNTPSTKNESEEYNGTSWTEGNNINTKRYVMAGAGTQTAGLGFGGYFGGAKDECESYDGTSWTEVADLGTAKYGIGGCGTQTAALCTGGAPNPVLAETEEWDGSSWTAGGALNTGRNYLAGLELKQLLLQQGRTSR